MTVLVAIPYYHAAEWIGDAVRSVLAQTHKDTVALVACDGDTPPEGLGESPNLRVVVFPTNEGAPMTQQAMLLGSHHRWYAPMGADDWLEPEYLERLLSLGTSANASGELWHNDTGQSLVHDRAHTEFGVFDAGLLRSIGGYAVTMRCGQDTLLYEDILPHVARVSYLDAPLYHKRLHADSLTSSPTTGYASPYRASVVDHNREVRAKCEALGWDPTLISTYRDGILSPERRAILTERVEMVKRALA